MRNVAILPAGPYVHAYERTTEDIINFVKDKGLPKGRYTFFRALSTYVQPERFFR